MSKHFHKQYKDFKTGKQMQLSNHSVSHYSQFGGHKLLYKEKSWQISKASTEFYYSTGPLGSYFAAL